MINMYPGDKSCILSTLDFVYKLVMKHNVPISVTFDQPLYWRTAEIIIDATQSGHLQGIVLMLGCFYALMNLLGAITILMEAYLRLSMEKLKLCTPGQEMLSIGLCEAIFLLTRPT